MPTTTDLQIAVTEPNSVIFADGPRVTWHEYLRCSCLQAARCAAEKHFCKHTVYVIRNHLDGIRTNTSIWIPVVLPSDPSGTVAWTEISLHSGALWVTLDSLSRTFVVPLDTDPSPVVMHDLCRADARNLVIPHLLGLAHKVRCVQCHRNTPEAIDLLLNHRDETRYQVEALREICHWLEAPERLCRIHDNSDLIPEF